jgi:hypothetical protein
MKTSGIEKSASWMTGKNGTYFEVKYGLYPSRVEKTTTKTAGYQGNKASRISGISHKKIFLSAIFRQICVTS